GLAGFCPLVGIRLRQGRQLEVRLPGGGVPGNVLPGTTPAVLSAQTYYFVTRENPWAEKLTRRAQVLGSATKSSRPRPPRGPSPAPTSYPVSVVELDAPPCSQSVTAYVDVSAP